VAAISEHVTVKTEPVDYQDLQIDGVRVETYGTPSAAPPCCLSTADVRQLGLGENGAATCRRGLVCGVSELVWPLWLKSIVGRRRGEPLASRRPQRKSDWSRIGSAAHPSLVAHSMGGVPSLAYASANPVTALILLAPVVPAGMGVGPIDLPVDPAAMWLPPPHMIDATFWVRSAPRRRNAIHRSLAQNHRRPS